MDNASEREPARQNHLPRDVIRGCAREGVKRGLRVVTGNPSGMTIAETPRLIIRRWTLADVGTTDAIYGDAENMRLFGAGSTYTPDELRESFERLIAEYERYGYGNYAVIERSSGAVIGHCGAHYVPPRGWTEADWLIDHRFQGRGYGTEAARAVFAYTYDVIGVTEIVGIAHRDNAPSIAVMRRLGMIFREDLTAHGMPSVRYVGTASTFRNSELSGRRSTQ